MTGERRGFTNLNAVANGGKVIRAWDIAEVVDVMDMSK
jgi:hypothetical protein